MDSVSTGLAASSSQNSLLGGSFMEVTDKKALRGGYTLVTLTYSQKEENWNWKIKIPSRCCWGRSGFFL